MSWCVPVLTDNYQAQSPECLYQGRAQEEQNSVPCSCLQGERVRVGGESCVRLKVGLKAGFDGPRFVEEVSSNASSAHESKQSKPEGA